MSWGCVAVAAISYKEQYAKDEAKLLLQEEKELREHNASVKDAYEQYQITLRLNRS